MGEAIFGLLGVILGGIITTGSTYLHDRRRERAEREREGRNLAIEIKRAARLIDAELLRAQTAASICIEKRHWWSADVPPLSTDAWQKSSGVIAPYLSDEAWLAVRVAVEAVDGISRSRDFAFQASQGANPLSDAIAEQHVPMRSDVMRGRTALAPFVSDVPPAPGNATERNQTVRELTLSTGQTPFIKSAGLGIGLALGVGLIFVSMTFRRSLPKRPKPWDANAITATYNDVDAQGGEINIGYVLENRTPYDYRLNTQPVVVAQLDREKSLSRPDKDLVSLELPIFIPAGRRQRVRLILTYPCSVPALAEAPTPEQRKHRREEIESRCLKQLTDLDGFSVFDDSSRYEIRLPRGWPR